MCYIHTYLRVLSELKTFNYFLYVLLDSHRDLVVQKKFSSTISLFSFYLCLFLSALELPWGFRIFHKCCKNYSR
jgi:hypothetical protein